MSPSDSEREGLADDLRPLLAAGSEAIPSLVACAVVDIRSQVSDYADAEGDDERLQAIATALSTAAHQFLDDLPGPVAPDAAVRQQFRDLGLREARSGHPVEPMRRAVRIAARQAWRLIRKVSAGHDLDAVVLGWLGNSLLEYVDRLDQEVARGHDMGLDDTRNDDQRARDHLIEALLAVAPESEARRTELLAEAESAGWPLPSAIVVMRASYHGSFPDLLISRDVLVQADTNPALFICPVELAQPTAQRISRAGPGLRVAMSPPLLPTQGAAADRWAQRALRLVKAGVIPAQPIIRCRDHATQLWLHAEPVLRRQLTQELLVPLLAESPNSREILSETMLAWLESRDSAPAIAAKLGVHPQTVRYRWKRINELFGDLLHDSEFVTSVTMLLKATVPLWKAGNLSDVQSFKAAQGA